MIAQAIPAQECVHLPNSAWLISQYALVLCPVERCADMDEFPDHVKDWTKSCSGLYNIDLRVRIAMTT